MKQTFPLITALYIAILFPGNIVAQKHNFPSKSKHGQPGVVDTRIDNIGYWMKMAELGLVTVAQPIPVAPAVFTGSKIESETVNGTKEDSPDVPLTDATDVTESENSVFADPANIERILNSNNSTSWIGGSIGSNYGANYFISSDAGSSWDGSIYGAGDFNQGDPATAISLDGSHMYVNFINSAWGQGVAISTDGGANWILKQCGTPPGGSSNLLDKNHMWIDNSPASLYESSVYIAWTAFGNSNDKEIELVRSTDGGMSWSTPLNISSAVNAGSHNQGVNINTGPNGEVYAIWAIYDSWPQDEKAIGFSKSSDGGATFAPATRIIDNIRGIRNTGVGKTMRVNSFPSMAVDISGGPYDGNIYVAWTNIGVPGINTGTGTDVYLIRSEDEGSTWSDPVRINTDPPGQGKQHYFPWITCDPKTGILSAVFYDDREVGSNQVEVYCANSFDGGQTWDDFKVSDVAFTPSPIPGLADQYMGDYIGITARGNRVYPVWTDTRNGLFMTYTSPYVTNDLLQPTGLTTTLDEVAGEVTLNWQFEGKDFLFFNIYRDNLLLDTTTSLTFSDSLPDYGIYMYKVKAMHDEGESIGAQASVLWGNPQIAVTPSEINVSLLPEDSTIEWMTIANNGELELQYDIETDITTGKQVNSYCSAHGGCVEFISHVILGEINNASACSGYADYTYLSATLAPNETYSITIMNGVSYPEDDLGVWIDWNQDGDFQDPGENIVCEANNGGEGTFSFTVPSNALPGETRMRIRLKWSGSDCGIPCGNSLFGEVEDYTINVTGWLTLNPLTGNIGAGNSDNIDVHLDASGLPEGIYTADLNISNNDPNAPVVTVPVTLVVGENILWVSATATPSSVCEGESAQLQASAMGGTGSYTYSWNSDPPGFTSTDPEPEVTPSVTTTYTVEVSDGNNTTSDDVTVTVHPLPVVTLEPFDTVYLNTQPFELTGGMPGGGTYTGPGVTGNTFDPAAAGFGTHTITYTFTDPLGCENFALEDIVVDEISAVANHPGPDEVAIFPNPNTGKFIVKPNFKGEVNLTIKVLNITGTVILTENDLNSSSGNEMEIDLSGRPAGIYFIRVYNDRFNLLKKVVVENEGH